MPRYPRWTSFLYADQDVPCSECNRRATVAALDVGDEYRIDLCRDCLMRFVAAIDAAAGPAPPDPA